MHSGYCPALFGVLFCVVVSGCRYTPSAADSHLRLLGRAVSGARFLTGSVLECDIAHRRSVPVLCLLYKIVRNPMHSLYGGLPVLYLPVLLTRGEHIGILVCLLAVPHYLYSLFILHDLYVIINEFQL